ncbi:MAG: hypothetical protein HY341_00335 [Candidatus Kerfeldbacteria bacterium]|nr:hypothetical protein [Candidatus Kerfeldbacteria bacterium]
MNTTATGDAKTTVVLYGVLLWLLAWELPWLVLLDRFYGAVNWPTVAGFALMSAATLVLAFARRTVAGVLFMAVSVFAVLVTLGVWYVLDSPVTGRYPFQFSYAHALLEFDPERAWVRAGRACDLAQRCPPGTVPTAGQRNVTPAFWCTGHVEKP